MILPLRSLRKSLHSLSRLFGCRQLFGYQKAGVLALATSIFLPQTEPREASMTKLIGQV